MADSLLAVSAPPIPLPMPEPTPAAEAEDDNEGAEARPPEAREEVAPADVAVTVDAARGLVPCSPQ